MKKPPEIVFASFGQLVRNDEFKITTKIIKRGSKTITRKEAYSRHASGHIKNLKTNYEVLTKAVSAKEGFRVVNLLGSGDGFVEFEYITGQNAEYKAFKSVTSRDYQIVISILDAVFGLIDGFSAERSSSETKEVKKINDIYRVASTSAECANPGIVDVNLDNFIIEKDGSMVIFDYEWIFDQPITKDFIKTRLLHTFFARRGESFAYLPSSKDPFIRISDLVNSALVPVSIYEKYSHFLSKESLEKYWKAEDVFQNYVSGKYRIDMAKEIINSTSAKKTTTPLETLPEHVEKLQEKVNSQIEELRGASLHTKNLEEHRKVLERHIVNLEDQLRAIRSTLPYKTMRKTKSVFKKITGS